MDSTWSLRGVSVESSWSPWRLFVDSTESSWTPWKPVGECKVLNLELISNDEVRVQLLSHDLECLPNVIAARQCSAEKDGCGSQLW